MEVRNNNRLSVGTQLIELPPLTTAITTATTKTTTSNQSAIFRVENSPKFSNSARNLLRKLPKKPQGFTIARCRWLTAFLLFCVCCLVAVGLKEASSSLSRRSSLESIHDPYFRDILEGILPPISRRNDSKIDGIVPDDSIILSVASRIAESPRRQNVERVVGADPINVNKIKQLDYSQLDHNDRFNHSISRQSKELNNVVPSESEAPLQARTASRASGDRSNNINSDSVPELSSSENTTIQSLERKDQEREKSSGSNISFHFAPTITDADWQTPFPRWGKGNDSRPEGIQFDALVKFLDSFVVHNDVPNEDIMYSFDEFASVYVVNRNGLFINNRLKWKIKKVHIRSRVLPTEAMMILARRIVLTKNVNNAPLRSNNGRWRRLKELLSRSNSSQTGNSGFPFIAWYGDFLGCNYLNWRNAARGTLHSIPMFTTCANLGCQHAFPIPNYMLYRISQETPDDWTQIMKKYSVDFPFESKVRKVVWRGGLTGHLLNYTSPRARIGIFGAEHSKELFDLGIVSIPDRHAQETGFVVNVTMFGGLANKIYMEQFQKYLAILDTDGNSWSSRFAKLLCYNSVIVKVEPRYVDYFHLKDLIPWEHYVPVRYDLSDLEEKARFIMDPTNEKMVRGIISNANDWCRHRLIRSSIAFELLDVWEAYVRYLDEGSPDWEDVWDKKQNDVFKSREYNMTKVTMSPHVSGV